MTAEMAADPVGALPRLMREQEEAALAQGPLTIEEERQIGRRMRDQYLASAAARGFRESRDERDLAYLRALVERLRQGMIHRDRYDRIEVRLIDAPMPDGQAFAGGSLVFTTALLNVADEATVAGVVAHELAHLDLGHVEYYARRERFAARAFQFDGPGAFADPTAMMRRGLAVGSLFANPYRPEHELEADCWATTRLYLAGYDPRALARFFEDLNRRMRDRPDEGFPWSWRSHPYSLDRRAEVMNRLEQLRRWKPNAALGLHPDRLRDRRVEPEPSEN